MISNVLERSTPWKLRETEISRQYCYSGSTVVATVVDWGSALLQDEAVGIWM